LFQLASEDPIRPAVRDENIDRHDSSLRLAPSQHELRH
jgi:hypothetical protein